MGSATSCVTSNNAIPSSTKEKIQRKILLECAPTRCCCAEDEIEQLTTSRTTSPKNCATFEADILQFIGDSNNDVFLSQMNGGTLTSKQAQEYMIEFPDSLYSTVSKSHPMITQMHNGKSRKFKATTASMIPMASMMEISVLV